jgi:succinate dehydrogenase / fumarate reductase, cytochrome b subunit
MADNSLTTATPASPSRPVFRNIHVTQILKYRLPPAGMVSIGHRISGVLMFLLLPFIIWLFDKSVTSLGSFGAFTAAFSKGLWIFPALLVKLVVLALIWAYLHHFIAGVRHLWMDATHSVTQQQGHVSALVTLIGSLVLTLALGYKLFF